MPAGVSQVVYADACLRLVQLLESLRVGLAGSVEGLHIFNNDDSQAEPGTKAMVLRTCDWHNATARDSKDSRPFSRAQDNS